MAQTNIEEIHVLSLDGGGSRGIMESIMLGHIMDLSTLMTKKPDKITNVLRNFKLENDPSIEKEEDFVNQDMENSQDSVDELSSDKSKVVEVKVGRIPDQKSGRLSVLSAIHAHVASDQKCQLAVNQTCDKR